MALIQTGELLAATTKHVTRKADGVEFSIPEITVFDIEAGAAIVLGTEREFAPHLFRQIEKAAPDRPSVAFRVSMYNGRLQVADIIEMGSTSAAAAS